jgi:hypothetical protein
VLKFDLEFDLDPLFKNTTAKFDEGGAKGLLLNHLNANEKMNIMFDSADFNENKNEALGGIDDSETTNSSAPGVQSNLNTMPSPQDQHNFIIPQYVKQSFQNITHSEFKTSIISDEFSQFKNRNLHNPNINIHSNVKSNLNSFYFG